MINPEEITTCLDPGWSWHRIILFSLVTGIFLMLAAMLAQMWRNRKVFAFIREKTMLMYLKQIGVDASDYDKVAEAISALQLPSLKLYEFKEHQIAKKQ